MDHSGGAGAEDLAGVAVFEGVVGDGREEDPVARGLGGEMLAEVAVVDLVIVIQAEVAAGGDTTVGGEKPLALVTHDEGAVAHEQLGDEGEHGEADEDEEGPVAALDGGEAAQAFLRERVGGETGEERDHAGGLT